MPHVRALDPRHRHGTRLHLPRFGLLGPPPLPHLYNVPPWVHSFPPPPPPRTALKLNSPPPRRPPKPSTSRPVPGACGPETEANCHLAGPWGVLGRRIGARPVHFRGGRPRRARADHTARSWRRAAVKSCPNESQERPPSISRQSTLPPDAPPKRPSAPRPRPEFHALKPQLGPKRVP